MKDQRRISSLLTFCAVLALASFAQLSYAASSNTVIYTTAEVQKDPPKETKNVSAGNGFVATNSLKQEAPAKPAAPLFCISLEPKGKATVSQSYTSSVVVTYYAHWTQSGGTVTVTFSPEDGKHPVTFSRSGSHMSANGWNASEWGGKPAPSMHRDSSDAETAAASGGHHFSLHL